MARGIAAGLLRKRQTLSTKEHEGAIIEGHEHTRAVNGELGKNAQTEEKIKALEAKKRREEAAIKKRAREAFAEQNIRGGTGVSKGPGAHYEA